MTIDILITALKFAGMLLSGIFGVFGLLVEFRDENDRITKAGRIALILIIASSAVAVGCQALELIRDHETTLKAVQRTETMMAEIERGLHQINGAQLGFWINVPTDDARLKAYLERFEKESSTIIPSLGADQMPAGIVGASYDEGHNVDSFDFDSESPLAPNPTTEKLAQFVLGNAEVELEFYREPIEPSQNSAINRNWHDANLRSPDLSMSIFTGLRSHGPNRGHSVQYHIKSRRMRINALMVDTDPKFWKSTGRIRAVSDLAGSQVFVRLRCVAISGDPAIDTILPEIRRRFELDDLILNFPGDKEFRFSGRNMRKYQDYEGYPIYAYTFPNVPVTRR